MRAHLLVPFLLALGLSLAPRLASAQIHAGVLLTDAVSSELSVLDVRSPDDPARPVRIRLARAGSSSPAAILDVWVLGSQHDASQRLEAEAHTRTTALLVGRAIGERGLADTATGAATVVLAQRDNIAFGIRVLDQTLDAAMIASAFDAAVLAAPVGRTSPEIAPQEARHDGEVELSLVPGVLDLAVRGSGDAYGRRTEHGASVISGEHPGEVTVFWVDARLRVGTRSLVVD